MTLLAALLGADGWLLASDRRLTVSGSLFDEKSNKITVTDASFGRLALTYTGLAEVHDWSTQLFIEDRLRFARRRATFGDAARAMQRDLSVAFGQHPSLTGRSDDNLSSTLLLAGTQFSSVHRSGKAPALAEIRFLPDPLGAYMVGSFWLVLPQLGYVHFGGSSSWVSDSAREVLSGLTRKVGALGARAELVVEMRRAADAADTDAGLRGNVGSIGKSVTTAFLPNGGGAVFEHFEYEGSDSHVPSAVGSGLTVSGLRFAPCADPTIGTAAWSKAIQERTAQMNKRQSLLGAIFNATDEAII